MRQIWIFPNRAFLTELAEEPAAMNTGPATYGAIFFSVDIPVPLFTWTWRLCLAGPPRVICIVHQVRCC